MGLHLGEGVRRTVPPDISKQVGKRKGHPALTAAGQAGGAAAKRRCPDRDIQGAMLILLAVRHIFAFRDKPDPKGASLWTWIRLANAQVNPFVQFVRDNWEKCTVAVPAGRQRRSRLVLPFSMRRHPVFSSRPGIAGTPESAADGDGSKATAPWRSAARLFSRI